jgi:hypothetical protein
MSPRKILGLVAYLAAVLLFFECGARLVLSSDRLFRSLAGTDASSWRLRFVRGPAQKVAYGFDVYDPRRGWALRPGLKDLPVFVGKTLSSDSWGFRGGTEHAEGKAPGTLRVLVLGDSFTFGEDVSDPETYAARLERSLPGVEVLNLGVHGYGHDQMLVALEEIGPRVHPDVVLLGFVADDMERNLVDFRDFAKPRFVPEGDGLRLRNVPVPTPEEVRRGELYRPKIRDLLLMMWDRLTWRSAGNERRMSDLTFRILREIGRTATGLGARPVFAYLPVYAEIDKPDNSMTHREHAFFSFCREEGIQSMYLRPFFLKRLKAGARFKTFGHWGPLEHETAAEGMAAYFREKGLLAPGG